MTGKDFAKTQSAQAMLRKADQNGMKLYQRHGAVMALQKGTGNQAVANLLRADLLRSSTGSPLDPAIRQQMESLFVEDFSDVRVHHDKAADAAATAAGARAYASGRSIVFGKPFYTPYTPTGRQLLAHELAHVVQQSRGGRFATPAATEQDAQSAAAAAMRGEAANVQASAPGGVQCDPLTAEEIQEKVQQIELQAANEISQEALDTLFAERQALISEAPTAETTQPVATKTLTDKQLTNWVAASKLGLMNDMIAQDRKIAEQERVDRDDQQASLELQTGGDPEQMALYEMVQADNAQIAKDKADRDEQFSNPKKPAPPRPRPAPPTEEQIGANLQSQLGLTQDKLNDLALSLGKGPISRAELQRQLILLGAIPDPNQPKVAPLTDEIGMDYAGRVGTDEDLARREIAARVEALGQPTGIGGTLAALEGGVMGGNAQDMQNAGVLGNFAEATMAFAGGARGATETEREGAPEPDSELQWGAPLYPINAESTLDPTIAIDPTTLPTIVGGNQTPANDVTQPQESQSNLVQMFEAESTAVAAGQDFSPPAYNTTMASKKWNRDEVVGSRPKFRDVTVLAAWSREVRASIRAGRGGIVRDRHSGEVLDPPYYDIKTGKLVRTWDMGHLDDAPWWALKQTAEAEKRSRQWVVDQYNRPELYQPEAKEENEGHEHEDPPWWILKSGKVIKPKRRE